MQYFYSIRIECDQGDHSTIDTILGVSSTKQFDNQWVYEVVEKQDDAPTNFIEAFIEILKGNFEQLEGIGISRERISIWMLYEYDSQCNFELLPKDLFLLGENKISLCVSCWESSN